MKDWARIASEYFQSYSDGRYDKTAELMFIYPANETHEADNGNAFCIGRPGVDGLEFALRSDETGIWVYYPLDDEWRKVAATVAALEQEWLSGALKV